MRSPETRKVEVYAQAVRGLLALERDSGKRAKYLEFIDIYAGLTVNEFRRYQRQYPEESTTMAGVIQRARDEGMRRECAGVASKGSGRFCNDCCGDDSVSYRPESPKG